MITFAAEAVGHLDFAVVFEIEVQVDGPGAFTFGIDAEAQPVVRTPVDTLEIISGQARAAAQAPAEHFLGHGGRFEPQAVRAFHGTVFR